VNFCTIETFVWVVILNEGVLLLLVDGLMAGIGPICLTANGLWYRPSSSHDDVSGPLEIVSDGGKADLGCGFDDTDPSHAPER
jgi:hypothetical protein